MGQYVSMKPAFGWNKKEKKNLVPGPWLHWYLCPWQQGISPRWALLALLKWYPIIKSSHCNYWIPPYDWSQPQDHDPFWPPITFRLLSDGSEQTQCHSSTALGWHISLIVQFVWISCTLIVPSIVDKSPITSYWALLSESHAVMIRAQFSQVPWCQRPVVHNFAAR